MQGKDCHGGQEVGVGMQEERLESSGRTEPGEVPVLLSAYSGIA